MTMTGDKQQKEPPYGDFLSITRKGLSWAENLCQKVEKICTEKPSRCVDAVGGHLKKMLDVLVHDLESESDDDLVPFSDTSLGHGAMLEYFEKKRAELDGIALEGELSPCGDREFVTSCTVDLSLKHDNGVNTTQKNASIVKLDSMEVVKTFYSEDDSSWEDENVTEVSNMSRVGLEEKSSDENLICVEQNRTVDFYDDLNQVALPNEPQLLSEKDTSDKFRETLIAQGEGLNCSVSREYIYESFPDGITDYQMEYLSSSSKSLSSISNESNLPGLQSSFQSVCFDPKPQEGLYDLETCGSEYPMQEGPDKIEACLMSPKCAFTKNLNTFRSEEEFNNLSFSSVEADDTNDFEDVKLDDDFDAVQIEDCWDDILKDEIALISSQADKRLSYKKILKRMLISRLRTSRDNRLVKYHDDLLSQASSVSDWELL